MRKIDLSFNLLKFTTMKHTTKKELLELFLGEETYTKKDLIQLTKQLGGLLIILALVNLLS